MKIKHLKEMTASALTASYLALTNSSVVFAASGGQVQSKLTQAANTVQSILTGLVVLVALAAAVIWLLPWVYSLFT
ncbi:CagC family type IV secretion system protein [Ligilactobacillus agilis]